MLHVTNGGDAGDKLHRAGLGGEIVVWKDVLHEGPVPGDASPDEMRAIRARFIAGQGWGAYDEVLTDFQRRDAALARFAEHDEVVLWFEHDLYDQLQLVQILDWFAAWDLGRTRLMLISIDAFPGVDRFHGLGQLTPEQLGSLFPFRRTVTDDQLALARTTWGAFGAPEPTGLLDLIDGDSSALPFLRAAMSRHLAQFPATRDGLSRTERQILEAVANGADTPVAAFQADQAREEAPFMGDTVLWSYFRDLAAGEAPLLRLSAPALALTDEGFGQQRLALTSAGAAVLAGEEDRVALMGIDRWLGGVHLQGDRVGWRWGGQRLVGVAGTGGP